MLRHTRLIPALGVLALALPSLQAAVWPEEWQSFQRTAVQRIGAPDKDLWEEYGFQEGEQAEYAAGKTRFKAAAYRFHDSTGAMAAYQHLRPAEGKASKLSEMSVETEGGALLAYGNYVFRFEGANPSAENVAALVDNLPRLEQSPLPTLIGYLPSDRLVPNSGRFVTGPVSLARFHPAIPPSVAGFHYGTEAQLATYRSNDHQLQLAIFSYPTPNIARERLAAFEKLPGAMAKRSGPLVAVTLSPSSADMAERVLAQVRYQASISWSEQTQQENVGAIMVNVFTMAGVMVLFCLIIGVSLGGLKVALARMFGKKHADEAMIVLHLEDR